LSYYLTLLLCYICIKGIVFLTLPLNKHAIE
jgi:hypothetical protein